MNNTISELLLLIGLILLIVIAFAMCILLPAAIFAAPGYVVLLMVGKDPTFWTSAATGLGSIILLGIVFGGLNISFVTRPLKKFPGEKE